jgi:SOS response regulatory protein OraA/RecX
MGTERIRIELLQRGAPEETVDEAMRQMAETQRDRMLTVLSAKFESDDSYRLKAARFLFSRGFPEEDIEATLDLFFQT